MLTRTAAFSHCNFTVSPQAQAAAAAHFSELLLGMRWDDPAVRPLLELKGLREWKTSRTSGYAALERVVDNKKFYDAADQKAPHAVAEHAAANWGVTACGTTIEAGSNGFDFCFFSKSEVWADTDEI